MAKDTSKSEQEKSPVTPEEQKIIADWVKNSEANRNQMFKEEHVASAQFYKDSGAIKEQARKDLKAADTKYGKHSSPEKEEALAKIFDAEHTADDKAFKALRAAEEKARVDKDAAQAKITTPQVEAILDKELAALLPGLEAAGFNKKIGNGDNRITLEELKQTLGNITFDLDMNKNGVITQKELTTFLQHLPDVSSRNKDRGKS